MALRDSEFDEYYRAFMATTKLDDPLQKVPSNKVTIGVPNSALQEYLLTLTVS